MLLIVIDTLGYDFAGIVEKVGAEVTEFKVGERVTACNWGDRRHDSPNEPVGGAFANYISIPAYKLSHIPEGVTDEEAAAVVLVGTTALEALTDVGQIRAGSRVLILGGSSAVGSLAIQLAKLHGAWVATTASTRNLGYVSQFNPDVLIDYTTAKWEESPEVRDIDFVYDTVGETKAYSRSQTPGLLKPDGKYVTIANGADVNYDPKLFFGLHNSRTVQDQLLAYIASKQLVVKVEQEFPFTIEGVKAMFEKQVAGKSVGKNVLRIA